MSEAQLQGTEEWENARLGCVTASRIVDVMSQGRKKGEPSVTRRNYAVELACERLTGVPYERFRSAAMERGNEQEPAARARYSLETGHDLELVGFVEHPDIPWCGASADALVGRHGLAEFKNPNTATHLATLFGAPIDREYIFQVQWQMECLERDWCDWISYDSRLPDGPDYVCKRVMRDEALLKTVRPEVERFLGEVEELYLKLLTFKRGGV